jgi:hypothetical protein
MNLLDATRYNRMWLDQVRKRNRAYLHSLLSQSIEEFAAGLGSSLIESKGELVQVIIQMPQSNCALVGAQKPSFQQGDHTMDPGK